MHYDLIICGAGPAGLSAAIFASRKGMKVLVIEKGSGPGPEPRGETARPHPIFTELLGESFMSSISLNRTAGRVVNSPLSKKKLSFKRSHSSYIYEWDIFIERLYQEALSTKVEFIFSTQVTEPLIQKKSCRGVLCNNGKSYYAETVLDCTGHTSLLGRNAGIDYDKITCQMVKSIIKNYKPVQPDMEFFYIAAGSLAYAPDFPPAIAYIFPRNNDEAEVGLIILRNPARKLSISLPDNKKLMKVWQELKNSYPVFCDKMQGTKASHEGITGLTMANLHEEASVIPGLIHLGDAIGFVEASGGCGIIHSMLNAKFAVEYISSRIISWKEADRLQFNQAFQKSPCCKHIAKNYRIVNSGMNYIFAHLKSAKRINLNWWKIKLIYRFI